MKISTGNAPPESLALKRTADLAPGATANRATAILTSPPGVALQSAVLQPALAALRALPDFDHERVIALRDALAKGELPFDPSRLAGLIQRFHGTES